MGEITGMKAAFQGNTDTLINLLLNSLTEAESSNGMPTHLCSALCFDLIHYWIVTHTALFFSDHFPGSFLSITLTIVGNFTPATEDVLSGWCLKNKASKILKKNALVTH